MLRPQKIGARQNWCSDHRKLVLVEIGARTKKNWCSSKLVLRPQKIGAPTKKIGARQISPLTVLQLQEMEEADEDLGEHNAFQ